MFDNRKILLILHLPPPVHGPSMVGQAIRESELINSTLNCRYINLSTSRSVDEIGKNPLIKVGRYLSILWQTLWQLIVFRPQKVYLTISASGTGFYKDFPVAMLAGLFGAKRIYHFHNKGISQRQDKWLDNLLCKLVFHKSEVILLSRYLYNDIAKYVPEERVKYCANGVGPLPPKGGSLKPETLEQYPVHQTQNEEQKTINSSTEILFLSNLIVSKGVYILLEACKLLQQKGMLFLCTLVGGEGDISAEKLNQKVKEIGLTDTVIYAGKQYGADKEDYWNKADIFVHPTLNDCFPLVLLEAMQHGLPIVSTTEGAIPEIVTEGKTGFLVKQQDAEALADKLELLIANPAQRKSMGEEGRLKYEQEYTLRKFEERMVLMFND